MALPCTVVQSLFFLFCLRLSLFSASVTAVLRRLVCNRLFLACCFSFISLCSRSFCWCLEDEDVGDVDAAACVADAAACVADGSSEADRGLVVVVVFMAVVVVVVVAVAAVGVCEEECEEGEAED